LIDGYDDIWEDKGDDMLTYNSNSSENVENFSNDNSSINKYIYRINPDYFHYIKVDISEQKRI
jgi:hypothetical protein